MLTITVRGLPRNMTEAALGALFEAHGRVRSLRMAKDLFNGECKGFAELQMEGHHARAGFQGRGGLVPYLAVIALSGHVQFIQSALGALGGDLRVLDAGGRLCPGAAGPATFYACAVLWRPTVGDVGTARIRSVAYGVSMPAFTFRLSLSRTSCAHFGGLAGSTSFDGTGVGSFTEGAAGISTSIDYGVSTFLVRPALRFARASLAHFGGLLKSTFPDKRGVEPVVDPPFLFCAIKLRLECCFGAALFDMRNVLDRHQMSIRFLTVVVNGDNLNSWVSIVLLRECAHHFRCIGVSLRQRLNRHRATLFNGSSDGASSGFFWRSVNKDDVRVSP